MHTIELFSFFFNVFIFFKIGCTNLDAEPISPLLFYDSGVYAWHGVDKI